MTEPVRFWQGLRGVQRSDSAPVELVNTGVPAVVESAAPQSHDNNFNLIRLGAALQVLLVHAVNHFGYEGWLVEALKLVPGVPTFFFISGCLIYTSFERMRAKGSRSFFVNRLLRIYPALIVCVLVATLSVYLVGYFADVNVGAEQFIAWLIAQSTILQFYNPDFMRGYGMGVLNGALWTITVEVQFYALVPLLYWLLKKRPLLLALLLAASLAANLLLREGLDWQLIYVKLVYVSFVPWLYMFLVGFIVASRPTVGRLVERVHLSILVAAYVLSMLLVGGYATNASNAINPLSFVLLGLVVLKLATLPLPLPAGLKRFVQKNDFSYGLYLYHMPTINLLLAVGWVSGALNIVLALTTSLLAAMLSWYWIERPALSHKR